MRFNTDTTIAGRCFEEYVRSLFDEHYFELKNRSGNINPDLTIEYIPKHELFSVECKFKSKLSSDNKLNWADRDHISHYEYYAISTNIPTFIVIGLGDKPCKPERMFCLPLKIASELTKLPLSLLEQYERLPDKRFFWKNNILK